MAPLVFSPQLLTRFDLIGVDPRGVGSSTPVRCTRPVFPPGYTLFPSTQSEFAAMVRHDRALGESCLKATGPLLGHVDTVSAARDHEAVRAALGARRLSWLGLSYGTLLGATYAQLYPQRVRAMVLDGAVDHSLPAVALLADGIVAAEDSLTRFAAWCRAAATCALRGQPVLRIFDEVVARADRHPMPVPGAARPVTGEDVRFNVESLLLFKAPNAFSPGWPALGTALANARGGDYSAFATPATSGATDPTYAAAAVDCMDYLSGIRDFADLQRRLELGRQLAPHLRGASEVWALTACTGWPVPPANPPALLHVHGTPPVLLVNATHDPSTPYVWAQGLAAQIDDSVLLTRVGDGHTSTFTSACARDRINRYLIHLQTPAPDAVCTD